jgi:hypothetical protein
MLHETVFSLYLHHEASSRTCVVDVSRFRAVAKEKMGQHDITFCQNEVTLA